jgi:peptidoglycan/LPS O-acetylase OafA/YrhL
MNSPKIFYRPEIDGLRAVAVISVIFYHAKIKVFGEYFLDGGFIGVDIFFVISGYLITRIILEELQVKGSFNFFNFYEKRARLILPMLFIVIFFSIPFAWQKLPPRSLIEFAESVLASLFFFANFFFYFNATQYGADSSLLKPFLHIWSLGVEEQFYLIMPILMILVNKYFSRHFLTIFGALSFMSLLFAVLMAVENYKLNFFLPFSRFWEFVIGSMLAKKELNCRSFYESSTKQILSILGFCLMVCGILIFDSKTRHPIFFTIITIVGVGLIIRFASKDDLVGKLLSSKLFVSVGLISYSIYLWHYPIFAFQRVSLKLMTNLDKLFLIFITFILSIFSYFLIERYFRDRSKMKSKLFFLIILILTIAFGALSILTIKKDGFTNRIDNFFSLTAQQYEKNIKHDKVSNQTLTGSSKKEKVIIIGDSYVENWQVFGTYISEKFEVVNLEYIGCKLEIGNDQVVFAKKHDQKKECDFIIDFLFNVEQMRNIVSIVLVSHQPFSYQVNKFRFDLIKYIKDKSLAAEVFIIGNYFQLNSNYIDSCLNLMFQLDASDAKVCIDKSTHFNPELEKKELSNKIFDPKDLDYKYVSVFDVLRNKDGSWPHEYKGVPFTTDWHHMTKAMVQLFSLKLSKYDGKNDAILSLKKILRN